ncbi:3-phosphoshikimate 1-carboxyvinyltransferase [Propionispora hippei]|uniref:3-phosphoshikimate 1-carboxyvinyltransferase n=1 Tax=Propionispora hippei DSM 15287 TaxID=1123003 RepID=A0A1M6N3J4_9FIRM|nr:3-phosphoshikimate 1-carboxyvinyltransferase [Propionispora hippei]SHJ90153.1 3-phosphoshikimate 1-carboxyvinyltransferase [Propionispora hippei DSM 15287]
MQQITVKSCKALLGTTYIPGDKSVSHRSVMFAGLADTPVVIRNFLYAADCCSTVSCMEALGVQVERRADGELCVQGNGLHGLKEPISVLDAGNSGTTLRLMTGILACQPFFSVFSGDASLTKRPMARVIKPLSQMGCTIVGRQQSKYIPMALVPSAQIQGIDYTMPVASAQVKSAVLLAGLFAKGGTSVTEPFLSRDHTERMLESFGVPVKREGLTVSVAPVDSLTAPKVIEVPGDISSAAFWLVAGTILPNSRLLLRNVGINPTRTGILDVLTAMGANISLENERFSGAEPVADLLVQSAQLRGTEIKGEIIPRLIDEIPVLAVAALFAQGKTVISGAEELRVKETDRLKAVTAELSKLGAVLEEKADGLIIEGGQSLKFGVCHSHDDHRMAMSLAIAGLAGNGVEITEPDCVRISYPDFFETLASLRVE